MSLELVFRMQLQIGGLFVTGGIVLPKLYSQIINSQIQTQHLSNMPILLYLGEDDPLYTLAIFLKVFDQPFINRL